MRIQAGDPVARYFTKRGLNPFDRNEVSISDTTV